MTKEVSMWFGHPKGLFICFLTEMWERFSYYGMRGLLVLYLITALSEGGFGWTKAEAISLYGTYTACAWCAPLFGGVIADRWLGQRKSVVLGGVIMALGHFLMLFHESWTFFTALSLIVLGVGLFKPSVTAIVGGLYQPGDSRRDSGFSIFYMGINVGMVLAGLVCGWLAAAFGWDWGFAAAGIGMLLGLLVFMYGCRHFGTAGLVAKKVANQAVKKEPLTSGDKRRIAVIFGLSLISVIFTIAYEQVGGLMNVYAHEYTDRVLFGWEIPTVWFQALNPFFIVTFAPLLAWLWTRLGTKNPGMSAKLGWGLLSTALSFLCMVIASAGQAGIGNTEKAHMLWFVLWSLFITFGELCVYPVLWSIVTKLAPKRHISTLMAVALASIGVGSKIAGMIGSHIEKLGPQQIFLGIMILVGVCGVIAIFISRSIEHAARPDEAISGKLEKAPA